MNKKILGWLLVISLLINISTIATFSYYRWFKSRHITAPTHRFMHKESLAKKMGLTEDQSEKVHHLRMNLWDELKSLGMQLNRERADFIEILKQDVIDTTRVYQQIERIAGIQQQMQRKTIENLMAHRSILTSEQWEKFTAMMINRMHMGEARMGPPPKFMRGRFNPEPENE